MTERREKAAPPPGHPSPKSRYTAFLGHRILTRGTLEEVVKKVWEVTNSGTTERVAVFDDAQARVHDLDPRGTLQEALERLQVHPLLPPKAGPEDDSSSPEPRRGPGRPKLGVVSGEVTLLPRHWAWLRSQRGGASATIRRLVDETRARTEKNEETRKARETAYRFMWDMAPDLPGFEEASRALFAGRYEELLDRCQDWPPDIRLYLAERLGLTEEAS